MEGLAAILTDVGSIVTAGIGWMGDIASTIMSTPMLFIFCVGFPAAGFGVGLLHRIFR